MVRDSASPPPLTLPGPERSSPLTCALEQCHNAHHEPACDRYQPLSHTANTPRTGHRRADDARWTRAHVGKQTFPWVNIKKLTSTCKQTSECRGSVRTRSHPHAPRRWRPSCERAALISHAQLPTTGGELVNITCRIKNRTHTRSTSWFASVGAHACCSTFERWWKDGCALITCNQGLEEG